MKRRRKKIGEKRVEKNDVEIREKEKLHIERSITFSNSCKIHMLLKIFLIIRHKDHRHFFLCFFFVVVIVAVKWMNSSMFNEETLYNVQSLGMVNNYEWWWISRKRDRFNSFATGEEKNKSIVMIAIEKAPCLLKSTITRANVLIVIVVRPVRKRFNLSAIPSRLNLKTALFFLSFFLSSRSFLLLHSTRIDIDNRFFGAIFVVCCTIALMITVL